MRRHNTQPAGRAIDFREAGDDSKPPLSSVMEVVTEPTLERRDDFRRADVVALLVNHPEKDCLWDWQYCQNPDSSDTSQPSIALYQGEHLVGFCGSMPTRIKYDNQYLTANWCCDLFVDAGHRRRGIAGRLYDEIEANAAVAMGFGTSDAAYALKIKRGWQPNLQAREYFFHNRATTIKEVVKRLLQSTRKAIRIPTLISQPEPKGLRVELSQSLDSKECDALWLEVEQGYRRTVVRDGAYLTWKYLRHPNASYSMMALRNDDSKLLAMLIVRKTAENARIVDYLGPAQNLGYKRLLLRHFRSWSKDSKLLQVITSCPEWHRLCQWSGFLPYSKIPRLTVMTRWSREHEIAEDWFLMLGDSDGDMIDATKSHEPSSSIS